MKKIIDLAYDILYYLRIIIAKIYFRKTKVFGLENIPKDGIVMFASNHRNGAVDGYPLSAVLPKFRAIAGKNLTGNIFSKIFFGGHIEIYRYARTIEEKSHNKKQLKIASDTLAKREHILIFPEGTSKLGPALLEIQKGAAFICKSLIDSLEENVPVYIVPIGLHYDAGWQFRSSVEVHVGNPIKIDKENSKSLSGLTNIIKESLESVTVNFKSSEEQLQGESLATLMSTYTNIPSHMEFCRMAQNIPDKLKEKFEQIKRMGKVSLFNGAPIAKPHGTWKYTLYFWLMTPFIAAAFLFNAVPLIFSYFTAKKLADDNNVITLWRMCIGTPIFVLQWILLFAAGWFWPQILTFYLSVTLIGLYGYDKWRKSRVIIKNAENPELINFCKELLLWTKQE